MSADDYSFGQFFCLKPDPATCKEILETAGRLKREHKLPGRLFDAGKLHLTVCPMGRRYKLRQHAGDAVYAAGEMIRFNAFDVVLDKAAGFYGGAHGYPNVFLADTGKDTPLMKLRMSLFESQLRHGLLVTGINQFKPHVTLSRSSDFWGFSGAIPPIRWKASELLLIYSHHDGNDRVHEVEGCWPLQSCA